MAFIGDQIRARQFEDESLVNLRDRVIQDVGGQGIVDSDGILIFDKGLCVPRVGDLIKLILHEAHDSRYTVPQVRRRCTEIALLVGRHEERY